MTTSSNGNFCHVAGHLYREFTGHRWTPLAKASDADLYMYIYTVSDSWLNQPHTWSHEFTSTTTSSCHGKGLIMTAIFKCACDVFHVICWPYHGYTLWHQIKTFSALLALCTGNSSVTGEFPSQRPVTQSFDVFLEMCLNKRLSKQLWGWWFETPSRSLWRHYNGQLGLHPGMVLPICWVIYMCHSLTPFFNLCGIKPDLFGSLFHFI